MQKKQLLTRRKRLRYAFNRLGIWNYKKSVNGYKNSLFPRETHRRYATPKSNAFALAGIESIVAFFPPVMVLYF